VPQDRAESSFPSYPGSMVRLLIVDDEWCRAAAGTCVQMMWAGLGVAMAAGEDFERATPCVRAEFVVEPVDEQPVTWPVEAPS